MFELHAHLRTDVIYWSDEKSSHRNLGCICGEGSHRYGIYAKRDDAVKAMLEAKGVWLLGDTGPQREFVPEHNIAYWSIEEV